MADKGLGHFLKESSASLHNLLMFEFDEELEATAKKKAMKGERASCNFMGARMHSKYFELV